MLKGRKIKVKVCELVEDMEVYPRAVVDDVHVADLLYALEAGAELPLIIVEESTKRIVDGMHRKRMWQRKLGPEGEITVEARVYAGDSELFLDAARLNSHAVRKLARSDQVRVVVFAQRLGVQDSDIASALSMPVERVQELAVRVVISTEGESIPSKRGLEHMQGNQVTPEQLAALRARRGITIHRQVAELRRDITAGCANLADPKVCHALLDLADLILRTVPRVESVAA